MTSALVRSVDAPAGETPHLHRRGGADQVELGEVRVHVLMLARFAAGLEPHLTFAGLAVLGVEGHVRAV